MSAQAYTNRRRILAEVAVPKVQHKKFIAVNRNPLAATINCNPEFTSLQYTDVCVCPFNGYGTPAPIPVPPIPPILCIPTYDGGVSTTNGNIIFSGTDSLTIPNLPVLQGGFQQSGCTDIYITEQIYDGGNVSTTNAPILSGS